VQTDNDAGNTVDVQQPVVIAPAAGNAAPVNNGAPVEDTNKSPTGSTSLHLEEWIKLFAEGELSEVVYSRWQSVFIHPDVAEPPTNVIHLEDWLSVYKAPTSPSSLLRYQNFADALMSDTIGDVCAQTKFSS